MNERGETYVILGGRAILCLVCRQMSYNPNDIEHKYCGFCHQFHSDLEAMFSEEGLEALREIAIGGEVTQQVAKIEKD